MNLLKTYRVGRAVRAALKAAENEIGGTVEVHASDDGVVVVILNSVDGQSVEAEVG